LASDLKNLKKATLKLQLENLNLLDVTDVFDSTMKALPKTSKDLCSDSETFHFKSVMHVVLKILSEKEFELTLKKSSL